MPRLVRARSAPVACVLALGACGGTAVAPDPSAATSGVGTAEGTTGPATSEGTVDPSAASTASTTEMLDEGPMTFGVPTPDYCPPDVEPALEIGHGDEEFRTIDSGPAALIHGHQGGYHIVLGLRAVGLDMSDWGRGHLRATVDGRVVADYDTTVLMTCHQSGEFSEALWLNLVFDVGPDRLLGRVATVEAEFIDVSDHAVLATIDVTIAELVTES